MKLPTKPEIDKYILRVDMVSYLNVDSVEYEMIVFKNEFTTTDYHAEFRDAVFALQKELRKINGYVVNASLEVYPDWDYCKAELTLEYVRTENRAGGFDK